MTGLNSCSKCGGPLPNDGALGGGCPRCMLELGFDTSVGSRESPDPGVAAERPKVIGRYRILRLIGEGGMGAVYEAEQDHPRRTVALKIIKSGMASAELLRRFEQESQALGRLQHPGIAQIYEAGTVDTGFGPQPYFAMELIRGQSPREYAEANHLNARDRLQMMVKICDAVHHAHQRGLIHRDLKPGNIVVDDTGQPKILDFGVARVTDSDLRATQQTDMGQLIGTLAYMSPEQALADPLDIDTRSDVYSLGVILYELLAGRLPYTISKKVHEAIQAIREEDPARLSTSNRTFRGDIETIVAKALEKERERRYASAAEMAADIQRYLNDEPIIARRPSASYQLQKFARRNKTFVTGVAAVFAVLVVGLAAFAWQAAVAGKERDRALKAEGRANDNEREATQALARETDLRHVAEDLRVQTEAQALVTKQALGAAELNLYFNNIALADREWASSNIAHVDQLLKEAPAALRNWEWHYLTRRNHMEDAVIGGHREAIRDMAIDTDGRHVRTVSINNTVKYWDLETKKEISTESYGANFPGGIRAVSLGANGRILYSNAFAVINSSYSEIHKFWDLSSGSEVYSFADTSLNYVTKDSFRSFIFGPIALSSDGRRLVAAFRNRQTGASQWQLRSWEIGTARELPPLGDFTDGIRRLQFSPDGSTLALVQNGSMIMVNSATGQKLVAFEHSQGTKAALAFSPDSATIVAGIENDVLRGWKTSDGKELWSVSCGNVTHIAFSPNSSSVAIALSDGTIRILSSVTGREEDRLTGQLGAISAISFTSDGTRVLSAGDDKVTRVWNLKTHVPDWKVEVGEIQSPIRTSPDGSRLLVSTPSGLKSWNRTAKLLDFELPPNDRTQDMIFSSDGSRIVLFNSSGRMGAVINDFDLQVLDAFTGRETAAVHPPGKQNSENNIAVEFGISGSGDRAAIASLFAFPDGNYRYGSKVSIWELGTGKLITTIRIEKTQVFSFHFSPNGKVAALQSYVNAGLGLKEEIEIYDTATGARLQRFDVDPSRGGVGPLVFSPDGNRLAEVEQDRNIIVWDPLTGEKLTSIPEAANPGTEVMSLAFNPDGSRLVSVSSDGVPRLWDSKSGKALINLSESSGPYVASDMIVNVKKNGLESSQPAASEKKMSITFTPDGQKITLTTLTPDLMGARVKIQTWDGSPRQK